MTSYPRDEAITLLRRYVCGEIGLGELLRYVRGRNLSYVDELLDHVHLDSTDFAPLDLSEQLADRIAAFLQGKVRFVEFADWVYHFYRIICTCDDESATRTRNAILEQALALAALFVDLETTESLPQTRRLLKLLEDTLRRSRLAPAEFLLRKLYRGKRRINIVARPRRLHFNLDGALCENFQRSNQASEWWDGVMTSARPFASGLEVARTNVRSDAPAARADAPISAILGASFVPISVFTDAFWRDCRPTGVWRHPENEKMPDIRDALREQVLAGDRSLARLQSELEDVAPRYYVDSDGLVEVVFRAEQIGFGEMQTAVRLFCVRNQVRNCYLNGRFVFPAKEEQ
ncbi:MAG: hypothetical protein ACKVX7_10085 [Planctomycetota bacterium]